MDPFIHYGMVASIQAVRDAGLEGWQGDPTRIGVMVGAGIACAMPVAWALRRMVQAQLFGVGVFDAPTIAFASSGLGVVALGAALVPAWRAAR